MATKKAAPKKPQDGEQKRGAGAPSKKTQTLLDKICEGISVGKSARAMCIECDISQPTLWDWLAKDEVFAKQYARAKEECADFLAEEIIEIADNGENDTYLDAEGNKRTDQDVIARSRLRVDARKWIASKLKPKVYGDKLQAEVGGKDGGPLVVEIVRYGKDPAS